MNRAEDLKRAYRLEAHPEGGCFSEVYESPDRTAQGRPLAGSIYFMLEGGDISHLHVIDCDEVWYYHEGCGMRLTLIDGEGQVSHADLGPDSAAGQRMMVAIPKGVIFGARNLDAEGYTFVSCMTAPRFSYDGFTLVSRDALERRWPDGQWAWLDELAWKD